MQTATRQLKLWLPVIIWAGVIFFFSSIPSLPSAQKFLLDYFMKKSAHISEYAIFYYLLARAFTPKHQARFFHSFLIALIYAFSDEFHQSFVPGRHPSIIDVYFDSLGMIFSFLKINRYL